MKTLNTVAAVAALAFAGAVAAEDRGVPGIDVDVNARAPIADTNSDGKITRAEAKGNAALSAQFDKLDTNKDGSLDNAEFAKFESTASAKAKAKSKVPGNKDGAPGVDEGTGDEKAQTTNRPGTTDDSPPTNQDKLGPGR